MNVFIIPSWYPNAQTPYAGGFIRDQAMAIGDLRPDWKIYISIWGQDEYMLPAKNPIAAFRRVGRFVLDSRPAREELRRNVIALRSNCLTWSPRLGGNLHGIARANAANLLAAVADCGKVELIHAHVTYPGGWVAKQLSEKHGIPYVITEHMGPFPFPSFLNNKGELTPFIRTPLEKAQGLIAVSAYQRQQIAGFIQREDVEVIPNLVDEEFFSPSHGTDHGARFRFFFLGAVVESKGVGDLLDAVAILRDKLTPDQRKLLEIRFGGGGSELAHYRERASALGIQSLVTWLGPLDREACRDEYLNCDAFVLPSHLESFGVVLAEAMACGKPVITTRCGGPEDIVNERSGFLVGTRQPIELADAMLSMLSGHGRFEALEIRRQFLDRFSKKTVVDRLDDFYHKVIGSGRPERTE